MKRWTLMLLAVVLGGCANLTTMKMTMHLPDGRVVTINSGKDISIGALTVDVEPGRYVVKITDYSSNANVDAINAQSQRETAIAAGAIQAIEAGIKIGAKAVVPLP